MDDRARALLPFAVLDYEASSLSDNSYPIEAGWAIVATDFSITSGAMLIRPHSRWTDWSPTSEQIHGLSRDVLLEQGQPCREVVDRLANLFADLPASVLSADPAYESFWSDRLHEAALSKRRWTLGSLHQAVAAELATLPASNSDIVTARLAEPRDHRAEADALVFAQVLSDLMRRNAERALGAHTSG